MKRKKWEFKENVAILAEGEQTTTCMMKYILYLKLCRHEKEILEYIFLYHRFGSNLLSKQKRQHHLLRII